MAIVTTGTVVQTTKLWSSVSVFIDGKTELLTINNAQFYSFNLQCEDMSNILEEGMDVELCYKRPPSGCLRVISAWVGDRPDKFDYEEPLKPVYDQRGVFKGFCPKGFVIDSDCGPVFVENVNFFKDGVRVSANANAQNEISFDGVAVEDELSGASYKATCSWVGNKPKLVERIRPWVGKTEQDGIELVFSGNTTLILTGTVGCIPNQSVAVADVKLNGGYFQIIVLRRSFTQLCERIQDVVKVGDTLIMNVKYSYLRQGLRYRYWFAEKAHNTSNVVILDCSESVEERLKNVVSEHEPVSKSVTLGAEPAELDYRGITLEAGKKIVHPRFVMPNVDDDVEVLGGDEALSGVLSRHRTYECIIFGKCKIFLDRSNFYVNGMLAGSLLLSDKVASKKITIHFQAVSSSYYDGFTHEATLAWLGKKPKFESVLPPPKLELLKETNQVFYGIVRRLLLPRCALVEIPGLSTEVVVNKLSFKGIDPCSSFVITDFLRLHFCVQFKVRRVGSFKALNAHCIEILRCSEEFYAKVCSGHLSRTPLPNMTNKNKKKRKSKESCVKKQKRVRRE